MQLRTSGVLWFRATAVSALAWTVLAAVPAAAASSLMPAPQQNALVQQYCTVCHTDTVKNGGLSLEHFDAARPDPGMAAMIVSKLNGGALGASGQPLPDKATQSALLQALISESGSSSRWTVARIMDSAAKAPMLTAGVVRGVPSTAKENAGGQDLYRLTLTCRTDTQEGEMQLAWSPGVPKQGQAMSASADGQAPVIYKISGTEKMGNGQPGTSGPGAVVLATTRNSEQASRAIPLPKHSLTVRNVFPDETVVFTFDDLGPQVRHGFASCFSSK